MTKPLVIYHDNCADGFGAAFAAWLKLEDEAEYLPMQYEDMSALEKIGLYDLIGDREVYILDFSLPREMMESIFQNSVRVVWLDHHKTAFEMWCGSYAKGMRFSKDFNDCHPTNGCIILDDSKSGALLAWEYFHPDTEVPMLIRHIDDRDRWQFKLKGSKELHAVLASYRPWGFEQWAEYLADNDWYGQLWTEGAAILRAQDAAVAQAVKHARSCVIRIYNPQHDSWQRAEYGPEEFSGLAVSCPLHQSEIGHELANLSGTFGLVWYMKEDGSIICSLRSNGYYDVSALAKAFGGGGHRNAAGFKTDVQTLMGWLK